MGGKGGCPRPRTCGVPPPPKVCAPMANNQETDDGWLPPSRILCEKRLLTYLLLVGSGWYRSPCSNPVFEGWGPLNSRWP